jgi:3-deoxy-manno-octulosonate cytidylyltransferase (CMP-KDO synthetase)
LDTLRESKKTTPFSGTTAILDSNNRALWFSKNVIPAIRKEDRTQPHSPVYRHIGLYGYARAALQKYVTLPPSHYEQLEGLEQLRAIENGMTIQAVVVDYKGRPAMTGIDSPEDLQRAEALLKK